MSIIQSFQQLKLPSVLLSSISALGYETPTPIQAQSIPVLMAGEDLLAQAQTGTGKTAAFALPILAGLNVKVQKPQALIITPTRELAIQVSEAFQSYAKHLKGFHIVPIYGGQEHHIQLRALKRGAHVIVGTPGRVMDHLRRGTLTLDALKTVVLDEADEMLNMGFIDDIEWILEKIPQTHQTALFSATLPAFIQTIAKRYLKDAKKIHIKPQKSSVEAIEQHYTCVNKVDKLEVLTRFLEVEDFQGVIIFSRTKNYSNELAEKLQARGYAAAALNGDMNQSLRQKVVDQIKKGSLDIIVATDVAARGIDVERITHVINYDIPHDTESYIHRIGRTGRAGRKGKALLFITPREYRLLNDLKRATDSPIQKYEPPSVKQMGERRRQQLSEKVIGVVSKSQRLAPYQAMIDQISQQNGLEAKTIASALAYLLEQSNPLPAHEITTVKPESNRLRRSPKRFKDKPFARSKAGKKNKR